MKIRVAKNEDISRIIDLLKQVLEVHVKIRPDIFVLGHTKYSEEELRLILKDPKKINFVAVEKDEVVGYALCEIKETKDGHNMRPRKTLYLDDLCVDSKCAHQGIGRALFERVKEEAEKGNFDDITLNFWEGNEGAGKFYEKLGFKTRSRILEINLK